MIYDKVDTSKITIGKVNKFKDSEKYLYPIFYNDSELVFTLKNKFFIVDKIRSNNFGKEYIEIKSLLVNEILESIIKKLDIKLFNNNGLQRLTINSDTTIKYDKNLNDLRDKKFKALISFHIPTYYKDKEESKESLQVYVKELVIIEVIDLEIEYDLNKLSLAD
nr:single-strand binding protein [Saccharomycopsis selenospora]